MSKELAVDFDGVGKMYKLYENRFDHLLDVTRLSELFPGRATKFRTFWALRNISFKLEKGARLGIIGRNGAGKSTLLKLLTGNVSPTEGSITVNGQVQALLEAGAGFHPEFTGLENVEASLTQNGFSGNQIKQAIDEIAEFTELGEYLKQPFKSYSAGMQARLVFTTATTIKPDILIVDEILGAGDSYFAAKSSGRMKALVEGGASVLLVSHAMDQVLKFCNEAIWVERGRIVLRGQTLEVIKAYDEFIHNLQDRQLKAANRRKTYGFRDAVDIPHFAETFTLTLHNPGPAGSIADISRVDLMASDVPEETLRVGDPQDCEPAHLSYVERGVDAWTEPQIEGDDVFRSITVPTSEAGIGKLVFRSYVLDTSKRYSFRVRYRLRGDARLTVTIVRNGSVVHDPVELPQGASWMQGSVDFPLDPASVLSNEAVPEVAPADNSAPEEARSADVGEEATSNSMAATTRIAQRRWAGEGSILIDKVKILGADGVERAVFRVGTTLSIEVTYQVMRADPLPLIVGIVIFRADGINVSQHISEMHSIAANSEGYKAVTLQFPNMDLGNGRYVVSVSLHRELDPNAPENTVRYDLLSQSFDFEIVGNPPLRSSLVFLPAQWEFAK